MASFPQRRLSVLEDLAMEVLERRGATGSPEALARDLLSGFYERCMRLGLDGVLIELGRRFAAPGSASETAILEEPQLLDALTARLSSRQELDPGASKATILRQLADSLVATLSLTPRETPDRTITLSDAVRLEVARALSGAIDEPLAVPRIRSAIISRGRELCDPHHLEVFEQLAPQLDKRGARLPPQPTIPIRAVRAVERALSAAREDVIERAAHDAIDRATQVLSRASADAAARIEQPISHRLTPREVAVLRLAELRIPEPVAIVESLLASLSDVAELAWEAAAPSARAYNIRADFAVGELIEHPKFGLGTVQAAAERSIEVEFEDGSWRTLVHGRSR